MERIKVAGACLNQTPMDFQGNLQRIQAAVFAAREAGVQVLCLPELCISGYGCEDMFYHKSLRDKSLESLHALLPDTLGMIVVAGLPLEFQGNLYNVAALISDGVLLGFTAKSRLAGVGVYYEPRWFKAWPDGVSDVVEFAGVHVPIGQILYDIQGVKLGIEICEDAWAADRPGIQYYKASADIILNPSASDFSLMKTHQRQNLVQDASRAFDAVYVYANLLGNESGRIIYDGEILIASSGELLARNKRFSYQDFGLQYAIVNIQRNRFHRGKRVHFPHNPADQLFSAESRTFYWEDAGPESSPEGVQLPETIEEEFGRSVALGMFDYLRKSKSKGFVISLSGGADSSACLVLAASALWNALDELGMDLLRQKLSHITLSDEESLESQILTCVYQSTENNSLDTLESAESLAKGIGAEFHIWDIGTLYQMYSHMVEGALGRELSWEKDDMALQNIQARVRVPGIWMLANVKNALLITTSNRSESSVGYTTMDGDAAGGLAPLAGIDKTFILHWLKWAEYNLNVPELKYVNALQPSAELRPSGEAQTDEKDLMPYEILNFIEAQFVKEGRSKAEILLLASEKFPLPEIGTYVDRYFRLFTRNQWKRERIAPSFHLDSYNLDPKTGFRFPILSRMENM